MRPRFLVRVAFGSRPLDIGQVLLLCSIPCSTAWAQDSAYCRKVEARASSDAALLMSPKVVAQAMRFPSSGRIDPLSGPPGSSKIELRAGIAYSPLDAWRGHLLTRIGAADCRAHTSEQSIQEVLVRETDRAQLGGRRAQAAYLTAKRAEWRALLADADAALKAGLMTLIEVHELRRLTAEVERKRVQAETEVARLNVNEDARPGPTAAASSRGYLESALALEREVSDLRALEPWAFNFTGAVVPSEQERVEWFGFAEVTYSLGGLFRGSAESRYARAREDELQRAPYEAAQKLARFRQALAVDVENARRELQVADAELASLGKTLGELNTVDAPGSLQGRARLTMERISVEADATMLRAQLRELSMLLESLRDD
jgi:hypothetical protein